MAQRLSAALNISPKVLTDAGVFDRLIDIDSLLYVDPHLLPHSTAPELRAASDALNEYWSDSARIIRKIMDYGDRFWREAVKRLMLSEHPNAGLGYSVGGNSGSAVGRETAVKLVETSRQIIGAGIDDPKMFELVGLLEGGVGPDLISDMTIRIVESNLLLFTQRVAKDIGLAVQAFTIDDTNYQLPVSPFSNSYLVLFPCDILRDLPIAFCWDDVDAVCAHNDALRKRMNDLIGGNWKRAIKNNSKEELLNALVDNPEALADLLKQYREKRLKAYDFEEDILGETIWPEVAEKAAEEFPLNLDAFGPVTPGNVREIVLKICEHFRTLVEDNGVCGVFWTDSGKVRHERVPQLVFFAVADVYCKANNLDLSPETNSGRGPVDFKISNGYDARVLVELKWSKNSKLVHGFETQIREYEKAERTHHSIFLVIKVTKTCKALKTISEMQSKLIREEKPCPDIRVIDGMKKDSASTFEPE